ncbi:MAG TPA: hypothetical protein VGJ84_22850 [Polyangiaceae bacterium]|jgi:hypothetical protein
MSTLVKEAIGNLADAVQGIELSCEALKDTVGSVPADAGARELRQAAHALDAGALELVWNVLQIARTSAVLQTVASSKKPQANA